MKAEKFIKLTVDYDYLDISENWVAFSITRTLENTYKTTGITDRESWNNFLNDPFTMIANNQIKKDKIVMVNKTLVSELQVFKNQHDENFDFLEIDDNDFSFDVYKKNPEFSIFNIDYISHKVFDNQKNCRDFYYLSNLDKEVVYYKIIVDLPFLTETLNNKVIFSNLIELIQLESNNEIPFMEINSFNSTLYSTKKDFLQAFNNVLDSIENPYIADENDFCAPAPEFMSSIGILNFNIPNFNEYHDFFKLTQKYVEIDNLGISEKKFGLILSLAILKSKLDCVIVEDLFQLFPEENKIANMVALDYKKKKKNNSFKKLKI